MKWIVRIFLIVSFGVFTTSTTKYQRLISQGDTKSTETQITHCMNFWPRLSGKARQETFRASWVRVAGWDPPCSGAETCARTDGDKGSPNGWSRAGEPGGCGSGLWTLLVCCPVGIGVSQPDDSCYCSGGICGLPCPHSHPDPSPCHSGKTNAKDSVGEREQLLLVGVFGKHLRWP